MVQFFDSVKHYNKVQTPDQYQFFVSNGDEVCIFNEKQESSVLKQIHKKINGFHSIIHSAYILSDLQKPWQRKMFLQEFDIANQIKAKYFIFHLHESDKLYQNLDNLINSDRMSLETAKCQMAFEMSSRHLKNPGQYLEKLKKYRASGIHTVLDTAHIVSSGIYKLIKKSEKPVKKHLEQQQQVERVIKFVKKYGNNFDILHFADQATQFDSGKDIHIPPFAGGSLFQFRTLFTSIDLLDNLISKYKLIVVEFIDKDRLFRRALTRYIDQVLFIDRSHLDFYTQILSWYSKQLDDEFEEDSLLPFGDDSSLTYQISTYKAIMYQLTEICKQENDRIVMGSPLWKKYGLSHKVSQLLFIVELTSYFFMNNIKTPWDDEKTEYSSKKETPRPLVNKYINKLISLKIIKSQKQVFGSYLRGNSSIGDLDLLIDVKRKEDVIDILMSNIKQSQYDRQQKHAFQDELSSPVNKEYTIIRLFLDKQLNIDMYFTKLPNPVMELFLTGSKYFNIFMRKRAISFGYKLSNTQLFKKQQDDSYSKVSIKSQNDIFRLLKMKPVPPKFRVFYNDPYQIYIMK